jgi:hypothetical protein
MIAQRARRRVSWRMRFWLALGGAVLLPPSLALASDGGRAAPDAAPSASSAAGATYYESVVGSSSASQLASPAPAVPGALQVVDADATAQFAPLAVTGDQREWQLRIDGFSRNHERVDAVYDMVLVLPLPAGADGRDAFQPLQRGVTVEEGTQDKSVPLIYGGEKIVLKRNVGLEKMLLPGLVGSGRGSAGLPDLAGSGYHWTAWDTIVPRDDAYGDTIQARARLRYRTSAAVLPPDAGDPRLAAYLITWIPALPASIPPYAVRIDVCPPEP